MGIRSPRRQWTVLAVLAAAATAALLLPPPAGVSAAQEPPSEAGPRLDSGKEDALLQEACRYLGLTRSQLSRLLWAARQTDSRRRRFEQEATRLRTAADRLEERDPQRAAGIRQAVEKNREQTVGEIVAFGTFHLVRLLTREQIALAQRLSQGSPPAGNPVDPALLDPANGFVGARHQRARVLSGELRLTLPPSSGSAADEHAAAAYRLALLRAQDALAAEQDAAAVERAVARQRLEVLAGEVLELQAGTVEGYFLQRVVESLDLEELAPAVQPLARRLFLSPRFTPSILRTIARGEAASTPGGPRPSVPAGRPRRVRDYRMARGFQDQTGRGPDLVPLGGAVANGQYVFGPGQGLGLADIGVDDHYAVELVFRVGVVNGYQKLVDFKKGTRDTGLYLHNGRLMFYSVAMGSAPAPDQEHHLRLERSRATRIVRAFLDRAPSFAYLDLDEEAVFADGEARFFVDDKQTGGEQGAGAVASILCWDRPGTRR